MPLYVYKREDGSEVEIQHSIHHEALTACPETGQSCLLYTSPSPRDS